MAGPKDEMPTSRPLTFGATLVRVENELCLLSPWIKPYSPEGLVLELQREVVGPDHPLFSKRAKALAVARDRDDVLFEISDGAMTKYGVLSVSLRRNLVTLFLAEIGRPESGERSGISA